MELKRRDVIAATGMVSVGLAGLGGAATSAFAQAAPSTANMTPDMALKLLMDGNRNFLNDVPSTALVGRARRLEIARGQTPFAAYVSCSDSRVSPEILFGRGLGELFIIRNAGNTVDTVALGSIEYAVAELKVPLIVVMGHEKCGAVDAACKVVTDNAVYPGAIGPMVEPIIPAALAARGQPGDYLDNAVRANVRRVVRQLRTGTDPLLLAPQQQGRLKVIGAYYNLNDGSVDFFDRP